MTNTDFLKVPLTTIDQNSVEIGRNAANAALALIAKTTMRAHFQANLVAVRLIERASTLRIE